MILHVSVQVVGDLVAQDVGRLGGIANKVTPTHVLQHLRVYAGGQPGFKQRV